MRLLGAIMEIIQHFVILWIKSHLHYLHISVHLLIFKEIDSPFNIIYLWWRHVYIFLTWLLFTLQEMIDEILFIILLC